MLTLIALTLLYFLPSIVAHNRPRFTAIFLLNFFLGWTVVGWIVALVWALSEPTHPQVVVIPAAARFCCNCGTPVHARFCPHCGKAWAN